MDTLQERTPADAGNSMPSSARVPAMCQCLSTSLACSKAYLQRLSSGSKPAMTGAIRNLELWAEKPLDIWKLQTKPTSYV